MKQMLWAYWNHLAKREQVLCGLLGVFLVCFFLYVFIWSPLSRAVDRRYEQILAQRDLWHWLQQAQTRIDRLHALGFSMHALPRKALLARVESFLSEQNLSHYVQSVEQVDNLHVLLSFSHVPFDLLIDGLQTQWYRQGIVIDRMTAKQTMSPGLVDVTLHLE